MQTTKEKVIFITLSERKPAPKVGKYVEHKNAIIIKKLKGDKIEVYYTDQNGLVMKATQGEGMDNADFNKLIHQYLNENASDIKNILNHSEAKGVAIDLQEGLTSAKIKVIKSNGDEKIYTLKENAKELFLDEGDRVAMNVNLYSDTDNTIVVNGIIAGKNGSTEDVIIDNIEDRLIFYPTNTPISFLTNEKIIKLTGQFMSDNIEGTLVQGSSMERLVNGTNLVSFTSNSGQVRFDMRGVSYTGFRVRNGKGEELYYHSGNQEENVSITLNVEQLTDLIIFDFNEAFI